MVYDDYPHLSLINPDFSPPQMNVGGLAIDVGVDRFAWARSNALREALRRSGASAFAEDEEHTCYRVRDYPGEPGGMEWVIDTALIHERVILVSYTKPDTNGDPELYIYSIA